MIPRGHIPDYRGEQNVLGSVVELFRPFTCERDLEFHVINFLAFRKDISFILVVHIDNNACSFVLCYFSWGYQHSVLFTVFTKYLFIIGLC